MTKISIFGVLSTVQMLVHTALKGTYVGEDRLGNKYYKAKPRKGAKQERRWVMYAGDDLDASLVPPEWHGWLHHQTDTPPQAANKYRQSWIKPPQRNLTGTGQAYMPPALKGHPRAAATGDYTPWKPS